MNANNTPATPSPASTLLKGFVSYALLAMLLISAIMAGTHTYFDTSSFLTFLWPLTIFALANYRLRLYLDDHNYGEETTVTRLAPSPFSSGFALTLVA